MIPLGTKPAFDGNVELLVTLTNRSKYPAKPIMLAPGDTLKGSLLFKRLDEPAVQLDVYGAKRSVANPESQP